MTEAAGPRILLSVPEEESKQIVPATRSKVELNIEAGEPIRGQLSASGTGALSFYGWLELVAAIQAARRSWPATEVHVPVPRG